MKSASQMKLNPLIRCSHRISSPKGISSSRMISPPDRVDLVEKTVIVILQLRSFHGAGNRTRFAFSPLAKIMVALRQAVARNSPPDCCIQMGSNPHQVKNTQPRMWLSVFWQRMRDSNPRKRSQSPVCYRYTNPLNAERLYYIQLSGKVKGKNIIFLKRICLADRRGMLPHFLEEMWLSA